MRKTLNKWFDPLANPDTTSGLDELVGTFSINCTQLYVGTVHTEDRISRKVISLLPGQEGPSVGLYAFSSSDASRFVSFLDNALQGDLPSSFQFPRSETRFLSNHGQAEWIISKFVNDWHHGGGFKGSLDGVGGHIITKLSAERLKICVSEHFDATE